MTPLLVVAVLLSGAVTAVVRFLLSLWAARHPRVSVQYGFPLAVLAVNVAGSLIAGCAAGAAASGLLSNGAEVVLVTGIAGGVTTFSTFNIETLQLFIAHRYRIAITSVAINFVLGLVFAAAGYLVLRTVH